MIMAVQKGRKVMGRFKEVKFLVGRADAVRRDSGLLGYGHFEKGDIPVVVVDRTENRREASAPVAGEESEGC